MSGLTASPEDFKSLFLNDTPFLDVRAEIEFSKGTFPTSFNRAILNTYERDIIGTCYKEQGQAKAIELGHELVSGPVKKQRLDAWCQFAKANPDAHLYCWRGGMRSNLTQQWMKEAGVDIPLIPGGYKALRHVLLDEFETTAQSPMVIVGGKTGTAKTPLINALADGVDLEGFAHHRGSSFGRRVDEPPCQVDFENRLAIDLLKKRTDQQATIFFEDESRMIGPSSIPLNVWDAMVQAPVAVVEMSLDFRVQRILQEYVIEMAQEHIAADATSGYENYSRELLASLFRIRKRLGGERYQQLQAVMAAALDQQLATGDVSSHESWIETLLVDYYDPMYLYQLEKKQQRVVFTGNYDEVLEWAGQYQP